MRILLILFMTVVAVGLSLAEDNRKEQTVFETYPLHNHNPTGIIEPVKALVGEKGRVIYYKPQNELIVSTTTQIHARVKSLLEHLGARPGIDAKAVNIRIDVDFIQSSEKRAYGGRLDGSGHVERTRKGQNKAHFKFNPSIRGETSSSISNARQTLVVANGKSARLSVGEQAPYYEWLMDFGVRHGLIEQKFHMREVGASLVVEPEIIGDGSLIRVRLVPEMSGLVNGRVNRIQFRKVATEVVVRNGGSINIGGFSSDDEFSRRFLAGAEGGGFATGLNVKLTARTISAGTSSAR